MEGLFPTLQQWGETDARKTCFRFHRTISVLLCQMPLFKWPFVSQAWDPPSIVSSSNKLKISNNYFFNIKLEVHLIGFVFFSIIEPKPVPWWARNVNQLAVIPSMRYLEHLLCKEYSLASSVLILILTSQQNLS